MSEKRALASLRKRAKELGITGVYGKDVSLRWLENKIRDVEAGISRAFPPVIAQSNDIEIRYDTDKSEAEYVVFSGRHIVLDHYLVSKITDRIGDLGQLAFYYDGEDIVTFPGEEEAGRSYKKAAEVEERSHHGFHMGCVVFRTESVDEIRVLLEKILPVGGLSNPTSSGLIEADGIIMQFYDYDTYM